MLFLFILCLLITVFFHELAHMLTALICGVKVEAFSIGFGKPLFHKKIKGIDFRITPLLLGGYTQLAGEFNNAKKTDFLAQRYLKKLFILVSGAFINIIIAMICYLLNYGSIRQGIAIDWAFITATITRDYSQIYYILEVIKPNKFLLQLGLLNFFCGIFNLFPFPSLDGGMIWLVWLEKIFPKNFQKIIKISSTIGFTILMILQVVFVWYIFRV